MKTLALGFIILLTSCIQSEEPQVSSLDGSAVFNNNNDNNQYQYELFIKPIDDQVVVEGNGLYIQPELMEYPLDVVFYSCRFDRVYDGDVDNDSSEDCRNLPVDERDTMSMFSFTQDTGYFNWGEVPYYAHEEGEDYNTDGLSGFFEVKIIAFSLRGGYGETIFSVEVVDDEDPFSIGYNTFPSSATQYSAISDVDFYTTYYYDAETATAYYLDEDLDRDDITYSCQISYNSGTTFADCDSATDGVDIDPDSGVFSGAFYITGSNIKVKIIADDGAYQSSQSFSVNVTP
ncbi:MAG: hypothetical protein H6621_10030 [Halobacteriovoraceae bacterium]|nr:hypothetical protein [Halobacteriovoraceae bacterium]MCB9095395.1 hypothetical protein [Halobacteriovoraceae bacterium]